MPAASRTAGGSRGKSPTTSRPICAASRPRASAATQAFAEADNWLAAIAAQSPSYAEEMRGIAEGCGQSEATIALLNARYELAFTCSARRRRRAASWRAGRTRRLHHLRPRSRTSTADRHTWLGQNWDWLEGVHGRTFVLQARRKDKPSFVCLTEAGIAGGKMGVNECGIGLVENGLASEPRRPQSLSETVPRALPRGAGRGTFRRCARGR